MPGRPAPHVLRNEREHRAALAALDELRDRDPPKGSADRDRLELLSMLVAAYEDGRVPRAGARNRGRPEPEGARPRATPSAPRAAVPWYEDDAGWKRFEPVIFPPERLAKAPLEVDQVLALLDLAPGSRVLDLCCGPGRHSIELVRRGFRVVAVDRTAHYLDRAREHAARERLEVELVRERMEDFCRPDAFDAALSLYTSFGYHEDPAQDRQTLLNLRRSLRKGGKLVLEIHGKEEVSRHYKPRHWFPVEGGGLVLQERAVVDAWSRLDTRWLLFDGDGRHEFTFSVRPYAAPELEALLRSTGFAAVDLFGGLDGRPYDASATHLVARAAAGR